MRTFSLDMIPGGAQTAVACNQYESGDTWVFALYYDGGRYEIPTGAEVFITGTKPDGAAYKIAGTVVDNAVVIEVTEQMTACAGRSIAEILVESETDGTTLYSANFPLLVEPAAVQGDLSPSEIPSAIVDTDGNVYYESKSILGLYPVESASGDIAVIHDGADSLPVRDLSVAIEPVQAGSGDPSPSNIRAITGWGAVKVARTGKNLLSNSVRSESTFGVTFTVNPDRSITIATDGASTGRANLYYSGELHLPPSDYYLSIGNGNAFATKQCYFELLIHRVATNSNDYINTKGVSGRAFALNEGDYITHLYFSVLSGETVNGTIYPQIEIGSTATTYEPYPGEIYDITLPTTVYGGTLDVTKGILTVDRAMDTITSDSELTINGITAGVSVEVKYLPSAGKANGQDNILSDRFAILGDTRYGNAWGRPTSGNVFFRLPVTITTVSEAKAWFGENPTQIVYELATPQTYTLTPTEVKTLLGENRIYADAGQVTVQYRADFNAAGLMYVPKAPTADGSYRLTADVTGGTPTYRWEAE